MLISDDTFLIDKNVSPYITIYTIKIANNYKVNNYFFRIFVK